MVCAGYLAFLRQQNAEYSTKNWECAYGSVTGEFTNCWCQNLLRNVELEGREGKRRITLRYNSRGLILNMAVEGTGLGQYRQLRCLQL